MLEVAIAGAVAGYAIAIPVGAIAVLIMQIAFRGGLRAGLAAAAGAATADGIYATVAALAGLAVTQLVGPLLVPLRLLGGAVLIGIGVRGLLGLRKPESAAESSAARRVSASPRRTYVELLALTLLNPATVVYFAALTVGLPFLGSGVERVAFAFAAFVASLSWQVLLALFGTTLGRGTGRRLHAPTFIFGNLMIIGFGVLILSEGIRAAGWLPT